MQKRSPKKIFFLQIITFGIYLLYWCAQSKKEVNAILGRKAVPTLWWLALPFGCFWWAWLYAEALDEATAGQIKRDFTFGIWLVAALGLAGSSGFYSGPPFHTDFTQNTSSPVYINWTVVAIVVAIFYLLFIAVLGIFPAVTQLRINKLNLPSKI
jgi:hypothetical protein